MSLDGLMLKDSCVKLYLSSRTEMQKIIEETRQQHLALQAVGASTVVASASVQVQRPFVNVGQYAPMTAPVPASLPSGHLPNIISTHIRPSSSFINANSHFQPHVELSQSHTRSENLNADYGTPHPMQHHLYHSEISQFQQQQGIGREFQQERHPLPQMSNQFDQATYQGGSEQYLGGSRFREQNEFRMRPSDGENMNRPTMNDMSTIEDRVNRDRRVERSNNRRDRERGPDLLRRRRSRSRSGSRMRERRRRSRSDERDHSPRERRKSRDKERDRNEKSNKPLLPTPPVDQPDVKNMQQSDMELERDTCVQFRLKASELSYRAIREYLKGIITPSNCIKMINALDGRRFGLAYIQFSMPVDKQNALARHNGSYKHKKELSRSFLTLKYNNLLHLF